MNYTTLANLALAAIARGIPESASAADIDRLQKAIVDTFRDTWEPDPSIDGGRPRTPFYQLVRQAVRNAGRLSNRRKARWAHVVDALAVGSTFAQELCRAANMDPDELIGEWNR